MEKSDKVKMVSADIDWSDMGSFDALAKEFPKDEYGNSINKNLITINSKNNFVYGDDKIIFWVDIENLLIVNTPDALLISQKHNSQKIKKVVKELKQRNSNLYYTHLTTHRPWGTYTVLEEGEHYKVKRIIVKPGKRLSLQKHFYRSEHWVVLSGSATVTIGKETRVIHANESTYIKISEIHRLENKENIDVVLIEVQVGEYIGEDDIVRLEDDFKRN